MKIASAISVMFPSAKLGEDFDFWKPVNGAAPLDSEKKAARATGRKTLQGRSETLVVANWDSVSAVTWLEAPAS